MTTAVGRKAPSAPDAAETREKECSREPGDGPPRTVWLEPWVRGRPPNRAETGRPVVRDSRKETLMYQIKLIAQKRLVLAGAALLVALAASSAHADPLKCRRSIAKNAAGFEAKKIKALQKCRDGILKGKVMSCPDAKATDKIGKALAKLNDKIGKDCDGVSLADMNFAGLASECTGGFTPGLPCTSPTDCAGVCVGGDKDGDFCKTQAFCSGGEPAAAWSSAIRSTSVRAYRTTPAGIHSLAARTATRRSPTRLRWRTAWRASVRRRSTS